MPLAQTMANGSDSVAVEPELQPLHDPSPISTPASSPDEAQVDDIRPDPRSNSEDQSLLPATSPSVSSHPDRLVLNHYRPPSKMPHLGQGWNRIAHSIDDVPHSWRSREFSIDSPVWSDRMGIMGLYIVGGIWIGWLLVIWLKGNLQSLNEWAWARNHANQRRKLQKEREGDSEWEKAYRVFKNREEARRVEQRMPYRNHTEGRGARRSIEPMFSAPRSARALPTVTVLED